MKQPIPRSGTVPLKVGDRVQIVPEWQDPGDEVNRFLDVLSRKFALTCGQRLLAGLLI
jgi:hypothetical protein